MKIPFYKYNKYNLDYEMISIKLKHILYFIGIQLLISLILIYLLSNVFNTPKEHRLKTEIRSLNENYYIIDKKTDEIFYLLMLLEKKDSIIYESLFDINMPKNKFESGYLGVDNDSLEVIATAGNKLSRIEMQLEFNNYKFQNIIKELTNSNAKLQHTPAIIPIKNSNLEFISSGFGFRVHPIYKVKKFHQGMDFVAKVGTPIYATADGVISVVEYGNTGYGNHVVISHDYGYQTIYGHMNDIAVKKNQKIRRGELIGTVGNTGLSTGPHLHYEVVNNGKPVNPINYYFNDITPEQYDQMLKVANSVEKSMD